MISRLLSLYALLLGAWGVALLFAPELVGVAGTEARILAQVVGGALIGFASASWTGRGLALGGIQGRALVVGNQAFAFIGALVLVRPVLRTPTLGASILLGVLAFGAVLYSGLMFGPWRSLPEPQDRPQ